MTTIIAKNKNYFVYSLTCPIRLIYRLNMKLFSYLMGKKKAPQSTVFCCLERLVYLFF